PEPPSQDGSSLLSLGALRLLALAKPLRPALSFPPLQFSVRKGLLPIDGESELVHIGTAMALCSQVAPCAGTATRPTSQGRLSGAGVPARAANPGSEYKPGKGGRFRTLFGNLLPVLVSY